jgi:hypothetical protein
VWRNHIAMSRNRSFTALSPLVIAIFVGDRQLAARSPQESNVSRDEIVIKKRRAPVNGSVHIDSVHIEGCHGAAMPLRDRGDRPGVRPPATHQAPDPLLVIM